MADDAGAPGSTPPLTLAADFPAPTRDEWRELVRAVLAKSGPRVADAEQPEDALATTTYDGIPIAGLYTADDALPTTAPGRAPFTRGATRDGATVDGWDVRQRHVDADPARLNAAVLADLEGGATSVWLALGGTVGAGALGVDALPQALEGVYLDLAPIVLDAGADTLAAADALLALASARSVDVAELAGSLGADPVGLRGRTGTEPDLSVVVEAFRRAEASPRLRAVTVDASAYHEAGASPADEIAMATATGVAYLRALTDAGVGVDEALATLEFRLAVTADQFASIATLRAARRVWDRVASLSGAADDRRGQYQHAVTSAAMMTRRDPWVNLLRTTVACFAAATGGADAITVAPFDAALGVPDAFARRIARNTHAVLHDESSLARVVDAAGGSWYVESLTASLAERAWQRFTDIERHGGALAALDGGLIGSWIAATREQRDDDVAHRRAPITGVSEFAFPGEAPVEREAVPAPAGGGPLTSARWAEPFETLRDRADAHAAAHDGERPTVFLAALGPVPAHSARVGFARNLFQAGGLDPVVGTGDAGEQAAAFAKSGSSVACLCSSDPIYADDAAPVLAALRDAGARYVWVAGRPGAVEGVDGAIFAGCDALAALRTTFDTLGVQ